MPPGSFSVTDSHWCPASHVSSHGAQPAMVLLPRPFVAQNGLGWPVQKAVHRDQQLKLAASSPLRLYSYGLYSYGLESLKVI